MQQKLYCEAEVQWEIHSSHWHKYEMGPPLRYLGVCALMGASSLQGPSFPASAHPTAH